MKNESVNNFPDIYELFLKIQAKEPSFLEHENYYRKKGYYRINECIDESFLNSKKILKLIKSDRNEYSNILHKYCKLRMLYSVDECVELLKLNKKIEYFRWLKNIFRNLFKR